MNELQQLSAKELSLMVSIAYSIYLAKQNGDNIYINKLGSIEINPITLSFVIDGLYEADLNDQERSEMYLKMFDTESNKRKCDFNIGNTWDLTSLAIRVLSELMDDYINMMIEGFGQEVHFQRRTQ